ncbi:MAG: hypothetical protein PHS49_02030, partial [Candidatus Gracilibacteria bacterium]|nr:hypothetical protein [Candidatus Gracilibacteria bacterium]
MKKIILLVIMVFLSSCDVDKGMDDVSGKDLDDLNLIDKIGVQSIDKALELRANLDDDSDEYSQDVSVDITNGTKEEEIKQVELEADNLNETVDAVEQKTAADVAAQVAAQKAAADSAAKAAADAAADAAAQAAAQKAAADAAAQAAAQKAAVDAAAQAAAQKAAADAAAQAAAEKAAEDAAAQAA